jgi:protoporphyrin/coproporphyrin ferrochelatase
MTSSIDCILYVSFGGPEGPDDVIPFLENVLRGKPVPRERMLEVAEHYQHFGGISPINEQNRDIIKRLQSGLESAGINLPIFWGNRNWAPYITDAIRELQRQGFKRPLPIFTNMFSSYSGCRQYRENIIAAVQEIGPTAPEIAPRLRFGYNHPRFIAAQRELIESAFARLSDSQKAGSVLLFTAHSIPLSMSDNCRYVDQLKESARLIAEQLGNPNWELVYQSRSGPPQQPWLEPDIGDRIRQLAEQGVQSVVVSPLGFVSDHMEVLFDLDTEAKDICHELGIAFSRASAVGTHPEFITMMVELIQERLSGTTERLSVGCMPALHDVCPENCCLYPRPTSRPGST